MSVVAEPELYRPAPGPAEPAALHFRSSPATWRMSDPRSGQEVDWQVRVHPDGHRIVRRVSCAGQPWGRGDHQWVPERVIWPGWSATSKAEIDALGSPLSDMQEYWSQASNRLRDSAKWLATVLGAALASLIGTSPLSGMRGHRPEVPAVLLAAAGLVLLGLTLLLVLQVMRPQAVSYDDVGSARRRRFLPQGPLLQLREIIDTHEDLYLPCGIRNVAGLREAIIVEDITLMALTDAAAGAADPAAVWALEEAKAARAARLLQLRLAAAQIATLGEYYKLRRRSSCAIFLGVPFGVLATAALVAAFVWPLH